jgi:hypothetical protein
LFSSCGDDDEPIPTIEIEFEEPTAGEVVADASDVHIHIHLHAMNGAEVGDLEVELHPDDDASDKIIEYDEHIHMEEYDFEQDIDLSGYPSGTEFHLEVKVCGDHDCELSASDDIEFSIP